MPFATNPNFRRPEVVKRIYELRTQGEHFHNIAAKILQEFDVKISDPTVKNIYERFVAKNMIVKGAKEGKLAQEIVPDYQAKMEARFDRVTKVTDDLMDTLEELKKNIPPMLYVKYIPTILMVCREIMNQLAFIKKEQSQVLINQKNLIYSPLQIMNIVNTEMVKLEEEGRIKIIDIAPPSIFSPQKKSNGRVLAEEEKDLMFSRVKTEEELEYEKKKKLFEEVN